MKKTFIESSGFSGLFREILSDDGLYVLQQDLLIDPNKGEVMTGCGGLRELRTPDTKRGKGKRGGARVIYLHLPEVGMIYLLDIYGEDEKDDLNAREKSILKALAEELKTEAIQRVYREDKTRGKMS